MKSETLLIYEKIVKCNKTSICNEGCNENNELENSIEDGCPPRGFMTKGKPGEIEIMVIGKNPGAPFIDKKDKKKDEREKFKELKTPEKIAKNLLDEKWDFNKVEDKSSLKFHKNLIRYLRYFLNKTNKLEPYEDIKKTDNNVFERCVYTNLVKCSFKKNEQDKLTKTQKENCFQYLKKEIEHWDPKIIISLGAEVRDYLDSKNIENIDLRHPSYFYKKHEEDKILKDKKEKILNNNSAYFWHSFNIKY